MFNHHPTIQTVAVNITEETIEKNLERIATLERAASHLQQPFLPSLADNLRSEYSSFPASGDNYSLVKNVENATFSTFSNFSTQSEHGSGASLGENLQSRDFNSDLDSQAVSDGTASNQSQPAKDSPEEEATPAVVSSESLVGAPSSIDNHSDQLRTISSTFLKTREKAVLTPNNVPTFAPPLPSLASSQSVSGAVTQHADNISSQSYENLKVLPKSSDLPTPSDTLTIWKSVSEEKNRN